MTRETGILMNNALSDFREVEEFARVSDDAVIPANCLAPFKRPLSSLSPSVFATDDSVMLALAGTGGLRIPTSQAQVAIRFLWENRTLKSAIDYPRLHVDVKSGSIQYEHRMIPVRYGAIHLCVALAHRAALTGTPTARELVNERTDQTIASYILTKPGRSPREVAAEMEKLQRQTTDERRARWLGPRCPRHHPMSSTAAASDATLASSGPQQQQRRQREAPSMVLVPAQPRYVAAPATAQVAYAPAASSSEADLKPSATGYGHQAEGYLDMGAYSGNYGAFGWYADYPVGGGYH
ncbi:unnamed protein product [Ixodes persulcatus]